MKKFLLATMLLSGAMIPMSAQEISLIYQGEPVPNGGEVNYDKYIAETDELMPGFVLFKLDPDLDIVSSADASLTVRVTSNESIRLCTITNGDPVNGGTCIEGKTALKTPVIVKADTPEPLYLDQFWDTYNDLTEFDFPKFDITIEIWNVNTPGDVYSVKLYMGGFTGTAGVEGIEADLDTVTFNGNVLSYDLTQVCNLNVYSLSGKMVINKEVSGHGTINMDSLSKGIYLYRLTGKNGKVIKTAKVILK